MKKATAKELETMIIDELAKIKDCQGVHSIVIRNFPELDYPHWNTEKINYGDADAYLCNSALHRIIATLHTEYELKNDDG